MKAGVDDAPRSAAGVTSTLALLNRLAEQAVSEPSAPAIIEAGGAVVTRTELSARARGIAAGFTAAGLTPGDRVLFGVRPSAMSVALMVGIVEAGGVVVPMSAGTGDRLFEAQMRLVTPRWVVAESIILGAGYSALVRRALATFGAMLPSLRCLKGARIIRVGAPIPWAPVSMSIADIELAGNASSSARLTMPDADAPALIVFTSGTTAEPKGVEHSHRGLRATLDIVGEQLAIAPDDTLYARDMHLVLPALFAGARAVIPPQTRFSPQGTIRDLERHGATHLFAVTADCQALLDHCVSHRARLPATLRRVLVGAAPVRRRFLSGFRDVLPDGARVDCVYGMTEMLPVASVTLDEKLAYEGEGDLVGRPVARVEAAISQGGELILKGPHMYTRYVGGPRVTQHPTGDLARIDAGRIVLLGRRKDMIIRREHNIYPELHEPIIETIAGVRRCAMVGVYDEAAADERVVLFVEPEELGDDEAFIARIRRELRSGANRIDEAAQPDLIVLSPIPGSGRSHKVDKRALRELARDRLACTSR